MRTLLFALTLSLLSLPVQAETWQYTAALSDGSAVSIDSDNVRRSPKEYDRVSFRVRVEGVGGRSQGRISGNCRTGAWRLSSAASKDGTAFTLSQATGDQLVQRACLLPAKIGR